MTCRRPPYHDACKNPFPHARTTGTSSPPHDVQGTCAVAQPKGPAARRRGAASGGRARPGPRRPHLPATGKRGLVGLGRLERPTSRLSGVRSNQLSYRPERHPAGPKPERREQGEPMTASLVDLGPNGCVRRDVQTAAGDFTPGDERTSPRGPHLHAGCVHPAVGSP